MRLITEQDYDEIEAEADREEERRVARARLGKSERTILDKRGRPRRGSRAC